MNINKDLKNISLDNLKIKLKKNLILNSNKIGKNKYNLKFNEFNKGKKNIYNVNIEINENKNINKNFLIKLFDYIKEKFIKSLTLLVISSTILTGCSINNYWNVNNSNIDILSTNSELNYYLFNNEFKKQVKNNSGEINYINIFNNFDPTVYKEKNTAFVTIKGEFEKYITSNGNIKIDDIISYINENRNNPDKLKDIFNIDFTIFQKGFLYDMVNSVKNNNNFGDLGNTYINYFKKNYGDNYKTFSINEIKNLKIISFSNFLKNPLLNGDKTTISIIYDEITNELGTFNKDGSNLNGTINNVLNINKRLFERSKKIKDKQLEKQVMYSNYIINNLIFLLKYAPKEFVNDLLSNNLKFEIGYGDNNYIDMGGTFTFLEDATINYSNEFKDTIKFLNKKLISKGVEIILDKNGLFIVENGTVLSPLDLNGLQNYFLSNKNSELKKILINSTILSDYLINNYGSIDKTNNKNFFIYGVKTNVNKFKKIFNLNNEEIDSLFKYGDINNGSKNISIYGVDIDLNKKFFNFYDINYHEKIFLNTINFATNIHELYHLYHTKFLNNNINSGKYDLITIINTYPYNSNYNNDIIFKIIMQELFYKAYKGEISEKDLNNFSYYSLSTFNYFEFIAELGSGYFLYPLYNNYIKNNNSKNDNIYFKIINEIEKNINFKKK